MRLAVIASSEGRIYALAVCRATFDNHPDTASEVSIKGQLLHGGDPDAVSFQNHTVELPSHLVDKTDHEIAVALRDLPKSMYLDLAEAEPCLREHAGRGRSAE
jgi:hypothetical protein